MWFFAFSRSIAPFFIFHIRRYGQLKSQLISSLYRKTNRHFKVGICEHLGISHLTGKKGKDWQQQANGDPRTPLML